MRFESWSPKGVHLGRSNEHTPRRAATPATPNQQQQRHETRVPAPSVAPLTDNSCSPPIVHCRGLPHHSTRRSLCRGLRALTSRFRPPRRPPYRPLPLQLFPPPSLLSLPPASALFVVSASALFVVSASASFVASTSTNASAPSNRHHRRPRHRRRRFSCSVIFIIVDDRAPRSGDTSVPASSSCVDLLLVVVAQLRCFKAFGRIAAQTAPGA
jgi:hypothetical protein